MWKHETTWKNKSLDIHQENGPPCPLPQMSSYFCRSHLCFQQRFVIIIIFQQWFVAIFINFVACNVVPSFPNLRPQLAWALFDFLQSYQLSLGKSIPPKKIFPQRSTGFHQLPVKIFTALAFNSHHLHLLFCLETKLRKHLWIYFRNNFHHCTGSLFWLSAKLIRVEGFLWKRYCPQWPIWRVAGHHEVSTVQCTVYMCTCVQCTFTMDCSTPVHTSRGPGAVQKDI